MARTITIFAPLVAELDRPIPALLLLLVQSLALISTFFLPNNSEIEEFEQRLENLREKNQEIREEIQTAMK